MRHCIWGAFITLSFFLFTGFTPKGEHDILPAELERTYQKLFHHPGEEGPAPAVFDFALRGMMRLEEEGKINEAKRYLTIIDFSKPSTSKRLWVVDLELEKVLFHCLVAHGRNTGENWATSFSNTPQSYQSSLGFYVTGSTYNGKHGLSLYLEGMEAGINDNARERAIVMHGADYVSESFVERFGRLGRSHGCPAVSMEIHQQIIDAISGGTCMFIWYPDAGYLHGSGYLNKPLG